MTRSCQRCGVALTGKKVKWCGVTCQSLAWRSTERGRDHTLAYSRARYAARATDPQAKEASKAASRARYLANRDAIRAQHAEYRRLNPPKPIDRNVRRLSVAKHRAIRRGSAALQITPEQLLSRFAYYGNRCWMCGADGPMQMDHVKPIAAGGPHMLSNIRPACAPCNHRKYSKWEGVPC